MLCDLVSCYAFVCTIGLTAIHVATKESTIDVLKFFFQMGANKNSPVSSRKLLLYTGISTTYTPLWNFQFVLFGTFFLCDSDSLVQQLAASQWCVPVLSAVISNVRD